MKSSDFMAEISMIHNSINNNHKELSDKIDDVKTDMNNIKLELTATRKDLQYLRQDYDNNTKLKCYNHDLGINKLKEEVSDLKLKVNNPKEDVSEVKYHGYFWFFKQFLRMNNRHKFGTVGAILLLLGGAALIISFLWWAIPELVKLIVGKV